MKIPLLLLCFLFVVNNSFAQDSTNNKLKIAAIPILNYNRTQGIVLGAMFSGYYKVNPEDTISPSSSTGLFGMYTSEGSYMLFGFQRFYLDEDKWRISAAGGYIDINFQFYYDDPSLSLGGFTDYSTQANFALLQVQRKVFGDLYAGMTFIYNKSTTTFAVPDEFGNEQTTVSNLNSIGYILSNDTRDNVNYPTKGSFMNFRNLFYRDWTGSTYEFTKFLINRNRFFKLSTDDSKILATRINCSIATGNVPFEGQTVVGSDDIRGYSQGEFRNDQVYTLQGEYRWNVYRKFGLVGFLGVASAVNNFGDILDRVLPGGGIGFRYRMIPSEKINVGVDFGVGKDDYSITFRIGESFSR